MRIARRSPCALASLLPGLLLAGSALAIPAEVTGGTATTDLTISNPAGSGWTLIAHSPDVTTTSGKTFFTATFPVNSRTNPTRPTSATFDTANPAGTYAGSVEISGFLTFLFGNGQTLELGDFSLAFDAARAGTLNGQASGYFLRNGRGSAGPAVAFDVQNPPSILGDTTSFTFSGGLLASPELAQFMAPFAQPNYAGTNLGSITVSAAAQPTGTVIPLPPAVYPAAFVLAGVVAAQAYRARRRPA